MDRLRDDAWALLDGSRSSLSAHYSLGNQHASTALKTPRKSPLAQVRPKPSSQILQDFVLVFGLVLQLVWLFLLSELVFGTACEHMTRALSVATHMILTPASPVALPPEEAASTLPCSGATNPTCQVSATTQQLWDR